MEKALKDGIKEDACVFGLKQVLAGAGDSRLIVISQSLTQMTSPISAAAQANNVPLVKFEGTSIALGKLCGLPFRVSTVSFQSLTDTSISSIIKESESQ